MEAYLTRVVEYLLGQSWQIAILTVVVAAATFALRNRSAHIRYLLWLIVLAKCLVPPLYGVPLGILPPETLADGRSFALLPEMFANVTEVGEPAETPADTTRAEPAKPGTTSSQTSARARVTQWLAIAWLAGVGVYLLMNALRALRANFWLRKKRRKLPAKLQTDIRELFAAHNLKRFPKIYLIDGMSQPFVWGALRGSIYLPADFANVSNPAHRQNVLGHELSHVLRFDAAVNLLQVIAQAIFWFHPFVWRANRKIRAEREKCCDEMAIARLNALPRDYSTAIVETLSLRNKSTRPVPSLAVAGPVKNIEERIKTMLRPGKKFHRRPSLVVLTIVSLLALLTVPTALVLTARAQTEAPKPQVKATYPLHEAAAAGDIEKVKSLLSEGVDINAKGPGGRTPLHCASEKGRIEVTKLLINQGARLNVTDAQWALTPLHYAAMRGEKQTAELLLNRGADINAKNSFGMTPLFVAIRSTTPGGKEVVELLAARGANVPALQLAAYMGDMEKLKKCLQDGMDINSQEGFGCTALHAAADSGRKDIAEFLISKGAEVDPQDTEHLTPLYYAVTHNHEDIADVLLAKGADVNAGQKDRGWNLLNYAIWDESKDAVKLLISKGANLNGKDDVHGWTPLFYAIYMGNKDIVELVVSKGADVKAKDYVGRTPLDYAMEDHEDLVDLLTAKGATAAPVSALHVSAREGDLEKVKRLIEEGADINAKDTALETPLSLAIISAKNDDLVKFLIAQGADVNAKAQLGGFLILHAACGSNPLDVIELLIAKGADVNAKALVAGLTPLHVACAQGREDVAELLIAKGADLNARTTPFVLSPEEFSATPLHVSSAFGHEDVAELLIARGADINARNSNSRTPLHAACLTGRKEVADLLIAKGADVNARDNKEQTPLSLAKAQGHEEIVELLRKHGAKE